MNNTNTGESFTPSLEHYLIAAAAPPKVIFKPVLSLYLSPRNGFLPPVYGTADYEYMLYDLAKVEAMYRIQFAKAMVEQLNKDKEGK